MEKIYEVTNGRRGHVLKGWYFDVTVRQYFDYSKYPLDFHSVWLRIWPKNFLYDDILFPVPDFDSYKPVGEKNQSGEAKSLPMV
ncbi:MAG: hypothetical protein GTN53_02015, partial [Candidatus Aminicenantes bacterium]|nr:hypothetical protein [Candidatus Aminicenantes bacterium]NIQ65266.1 hypothetical protein [Candidatus Aminicenantes bacterium]NIT21268.1 hypothetical protein [Candidatus Aminicenantes bacterium]